MNNSPTLSSATPPATAVHGIPVVDIGALVAADTDAQAAAILRAGGLDAVVSELRAALKEWGFFYISNHGVPRALVEQLEHEMARFFGLPADTKNAIRRTATNPLGFYDNEFTKNEKDWKEIFGFSTRFDDPVFKQHQVSNAGVSNQWPDASVLPAFQSTMTQYYRTLERVARRVLMVIAVSLGEAPEFFDQFFCHTGTDAPMADDGTPMNNNSSSMRLNYYPIAPDPESTMGVHHHTDPGALTVLLQDSRVTALQVLHRATQTWCYVPPRADTFVINIGDMVQVWSNDLYVAPMHRVLSSSTHDRYSVPFFHNPSYDAHIRPVLVDATDVPKYRDLNWRAYIAEKVKCDFANLAKEDPHISQYRIDNARKAAAPAAGKHE